MRDAMNPEQPPSGPLYAPETPAGGASGTQRGSGAAPGAQTGSEGFDAPTPVAHATPCGPNVCGVVTREGAAPAPEPGLREQVAQAVRRVMEQDLTYRARCNALTDAVLAVRDAELERMAGDAQRNSLRHEGAERRIQQLLGLLGEAVDWIPEGEMRERICADLNERAAEEQGDGLQAKVDEATSTLRRVRALHARTTVQTTGGPADACSSCQTDGMSYPWPCPTVEALAGPRPDAR